MEPTLHVFEMVILAPTDFEDVKIGDIVTFRGVEGGSMTFTHRVHGFTEDGQLITAGDANIDSNTGEINYDNSTVTPSRYIGKVVGSIYSVGLIIMFLKENIMQAGLVLVIGFVIYILLIDDSEESVFD